MKYFFCLKREIIANIGKIEKMKKWGDRGMLTDECRLSYKKYFFQNLDN